MKIFGISIHIDWVAVILAGIGILLVKIGVIPKVPW